MQTSQRLARSITMVFKLRMTTGVLHAPGAPAPISVEDSRMSARSSSLNRSSGPRASDRTKIFPSRSLLRIIYVNKQTCIATRINTLADHRLDKWEAFAVSTVANLRRLARSLIQIGVLAILRRSHPSRPATVKCEFPWQVTREK